MTDQETEKTTPKERRGRPSTRTGTEKAHTFRLEEALLNKARTLSQLRGITLNAAIADAVESWLRAPENKEALADFTRELTGETKSGQSSPKKSSRPKALK